MVTGPDLPRGPPPLQLFYRAPGAFGGARTPGGACGGACAPGTWCWQAGEILRAHSGSVGVPVAAFHVLQKHQKAAKLVGLGLASSIFTCNHSFPEPHGPPLGFLKPSNAAGPGVRRVEPSKRPTAASAASVGIGFPRSQIASLMGSGEDAAELGWSVSKGN